MYSRRLTKRLATDLNSQLTTDHFSKGIPNFLSIRSTRLLLDSYHLHLQRVAELAFGSAATVGQAGRELFRILEAVERAECKNSRLLHHASQAWNLEFFLRGLQTESSNPTKSVLNILSREFGSFENFKRNFQAHASAMIGCGWIWLVKSQHGDFSKLSIITTFNGASPLFKSDQNYQIKSQTSSSSTSSSISTVVNSPILGLNLWESAFILDYSLDRDRYINNWWNAINWNVASVLLSTTK